MNFIDLMGNVVFTDGDITSRTEAIVRNAFSAEAETIMNRKVSGAGMGIYTLTQSDMLELQQFAAATQAAAAEGVAARTDNERLKAVLAYEQATRRLGRPEYDGPATATVTENEVEMEVPHPARLKDEQEREDALVILSTANQDTLDLYALRNPEPEEVEPSEGGEP